MAIRLVYLTTLEIMNKGERIILSGEKWLLPSFPDATIVGERMNNLGWFKEDTKSFKPDISEIQYFVLSSEGYIQLAQGRAWYKRLSILEKIFIRFKFW